MKPDRLNALTDGVVAIVLTIMVLELKLPADATVPAILGFLPLLGAYLLSFIMVAIYWNNHHHMLQSAKHVTGGVLWANHSLLFFLTLVPLVIRWIDEAGITALPLAFFGIVLLGASATYSILEQALINADGEQSRVRQAIGSRLKELISFLLYLVAIPLAFLQPLISVACYVAVAIIWLIPDRRFEARL